MSTIDGDPTCLQCGFVVCVCKPVDARNECAHGVSLAIDCKHCSESDLGPENIDDRTKGTLAGTAGKRFRNATLNRMGSMIWGAPDPALVYCWIGFDQQITVSADLVPAAFFSHWKSFAEIARDIAEGKAPPGWCSWDVLTPGVRLNIELTVPTGELEPHRIQIAMWGTTPEF